MKTALITGASSGIGREFAVQLHAKGYNIVALARRKERLESLCAELNEKRIDSALFLAVDLTREMGDSSFAVVQDFLAEHTIDLLVNNAGRGSFGHFDEIDIESEVAMVELNIIATMRLLHVVLPEMKARKSGGLISISSIAGFQPLPFMATYAGTKVFNLFHSIALRAELKKSNIPVTIVCPGPVATEFGGVARVPGTVTGGARDTPDGVVREAIAAFESRRAIVFPGWRAKVMAIASRFLPMTLTTGLMRRLLFPALQRSAENHVDQ